MSHSVIFTSVAVMSISVVFTSLFSELLSFQAHMGSTLARLKHWIETTSSRSLHPFSSVKPEQTGWYDELKVVCGEISNVLNRSGPRGGGGSQAPGTPSQPLEKSSYHSQPSFSRCCSENEGNRPTRKNKSQAPTLWSGRRCSTSTLRSTCPRHRWPGRPSW